MNHPTKRLILVTSCFTGILLAGFLLVASARAERDSAPKVITVDTIDNELNQDGDCSLREAVAAANGNSPVDACPAGDGTDHDTIQFALSGTFPLSTTLDILDGGPLIIVGGSSVQISGISRVQVFNIHSGTDLTLNGLLITSGIADQGAGIYNDGALTLQDSAVSANYSMGVNGAGAGIYNSGVLTITASVIDGNSSFYHVGGGIYNLGQLRLSDSVITGNSAYHDGGGIYNSGLMTITNSTISGNGANYKGGGVYNTGTLALVGSTLSGNQALYGGGVNSGSGQVSITNSTLSGNHAMNDGGGISNQAGLTLSNVTLAGNQAGYFGGGIKNGSISLALRNSIIANNTAGTDGPDCYLMAVASNGYNLIGNASGCGLPPGSGDLRNLDARLGALLNYGGLTATHALLNGSPAIDAGDPNGCLDPLGSPLTTDQRGFARTNRCDIGAFEVPTPTFSTHMVSLPLVLNRLCPNFFDDFSNPGSGWAVGENTNVRVAYLNGEYNLLVKSLNYYFGIRAPTCNRQNYSVEVDARWAGNTGAYYGLLFGISGNYQQLYSFEMNSDYQEFALYRYGPQGWVLLVPGTYTSAIHSGQTGNHLKVTRNGTNISLEINGTTVKTLNEGTITGLTGGGLIAGSYNNLSNADARFDNFRITGLPATASLQKQDEIAALTVSHLPEVLQGPDERPHPLWWEAILP